MKLHEERQLFTDAITAAAQHLGMREVFIEKDYWVTYVLWCLSRSSYSNRVVFKGGTSLSKAYGLIRRFSEDIDLALLLEGESVNQIKNLMKKIETDLISPPLEPDLGHSAVSKWSKIRKTVHKYPRSTSSTDFGPASDRLILEINSFANPEPFRQMPIASYIAQYFGEHDSNLVERYSLENFSVNVLDHRRTFAEKVISLVRASYESDEELSQLRAKTRHIYDIVKLSEVVEVEEFIGSALFFETIKEVQLEDRKNPEFYREWFEKPLSEASLFADASEVMARLGKTLQREFASLLFLGEEVPPTKQMVGVLKRIGKYLEEYEMTKI